MKKIVGLLVLTAKILSADAEASSLTAKTYFFSKKIKGQSESIQKELAWVSLYSGKTEEAWKTATITVDLTRGVEEEIDLKAIGAKYQDLYGNEKLQTQVSKGFIEISGYSQKDNRHLLIKIHDLPNRQMLMVTTLSRSPFKSESEIVGKTLTSKVLTILREQGYPNQSSLTQLFLNSAHANNSPGFPGFPGFPGELPNLGPLIDGINGIDEKLGDFNENFGDLNDNLEDFNDNLSDINDTIGDAVNEWSRTNDLLDHAMGKLLDTKFMAMHGAIIGAATAAGAALGGWVVNQALNGAVWLVQKLIQAIDKRELYWEDFKKAREEWYKQKAAMVDLEKKVDATLSVLAKTQNMSPQAALQSLEQEKALLQVTKMNFDQAVQDQNREKNISCATLYQMASNVLDGEVKKLGLAIDYYSQNSDLRQDREMFFCKLLTDMVSQLNNYNYLMNKLRLDLLAGAKEWVRNARKEHHKMRRKARRINAIWYRQRLKRMGNRLISTIQTEAIKQNFHQKADFMSECRNGHGVIGEAVKTKLGRKANMFNTAKMCREAFDLYRTAYLDEQYAAFNEQVYHASNNNQELWQDAQDNRVYMNHEAEMRMVAQMTQWFTELREEMKCVSQYTNPNVYGACLKKYPEIMGPIKSLMSAENAMNERGCPRKFYDASKEINGDTSKEQVAHFILDN